MNSNEKNLQFTALIDFKSLTKQEKVGHNNESNESTYMLSPRLYTILIVLLATAFTRKHPPCSLTSLAFSQEAHSAHYIHAGLSQLFTNLIVRGKLSKETNKTDYLYHQQQTLVNAIGKER